MINENFNNIEIPNNIDEAIDRGIERIVNEQKSKNRKKIVGGIVAGLAIIVSIGICTPAFAENIPLLKEIFSFLEHNERKIPEKPQNNLSQYANTVGLTSEDNGIKITMQEVVYDSENVYISYKVESEATFPYKTKSYLVESNGVNEYETKEIDWMWLEQRVSIDNSTQELISSNHLNGMIIDDNTFIGIVKYEVPTLEDGSKPESFDANININYVCFPREKDDKDNLIYYEENKFKVEGNWSFNIAITTDKSLEEVVEVNEVKEGFKLEKIIKNPFYIKVKIVPLKKENQKINNTDNGGKELQQHEGIILGLDDIDYNRSINSYVTKSDEIPGTMYITFERNLNDNFEELKVKIKDYTVLNQDCTEECTNTEVHENSKHLKIFEFDTKIEVD